MSIKPEVSIIIVYYDQLKLLRQCLHSIYNKKSGTKFEVIVVNNSSRTISKKLQPEFKQVKFINSPNNLGFGGGNNLGSKLALGKYLFFLNPDTQIIDNTISILSCFLDRHKDTAIVAPNLINKNKKIYPQLGSKKLTPISGIFYHTFINKLFPNNPISRKFSLADISMNKLRKVDAVPGSAFMIRKSDFIKAGRFDENMFLYFEESDLGIRIEKLGKKIYINPKTEVLHLWGKNRGDTHLKKYYERSRFYYFRKHYGLFWALIVESFARFSKTSLYIIALLIIAAFLRFFKIPQNLVFHGELGHNYLAILHNWQNKTLPLLGPPTSHPWLYFGPLFYWIFGPFLATNNFNPVTGAYFMAAISTLLVLVNYFYVSKIFNKKIALISSTLLSFSTVFIDLAREARFFSLVVILFYPLFYYLHKADSKNEIKNLFLLGLFWGISLNFHLSVIIYAPVILLVFWNKKIKPKKIPYFIYGLLIPSLPFLVYDIFHGFKMSSKLLLWFPYRVAGFFGFIPKNTINSTVAQGNATSLLSFLSSWIYNNYLIGILTLIMLIAVIWQNHKNKKDSQIRILSYIVILGVLLIFIHGDPPSHYYLPLYIPLILLLSYAFSMFSSKKIILGMTIFSFISISNLSISSWYYQNSNKIVSDLVPYNLQLQAVKSIVALNKSKICLGRHGPNDEFEGDYAQNYHYLLEIRGVIAEKCDSDEVIICERTTCSGKEIFNKGGLQVYEATN